jgi:hypothetical protein
MQGCQFKIVDFLVNRKKKLRKGTGLAPIMAVALKNKFIVSKISCIYK